MISADSPDRPRPAETASLQLIIRRSLVRIQAGPSTNFPQQSSSSACSKARLRRRRRGSPSLAVRQLVTPIRTLVDGVPTFYVDVDGPFVATLAFRVGRADERLPSAGVTHLLEHLAMPTDDIRGVVADASVGRRGRSSGLRGHPTPSWRT